MSNQMELSNNKQEHEAFVAIPVSLSQLHELQEEEEIPSSWGKCGEACLMAILPCLLFVQFGVSYLTESPPPIHWAIVNLGIFCFIGTAFAFRRAFSEPESVIALVPEVLIDIILGLILFEKTECAAYLMFASIAGLGSVVGAKYVCCSRQNTKVREEAPRGEFLA